MVRIYVREVSLTLVSFTHRSYVAPPMRMGAWLMACVLWQQIEVLKSLAITYEWLELATRSKLHLYM